VLRIFALIGEGNKKKWRNQNKAAKRKSFRFNGVSVIVSVIEH